jgi:hypothetical protein
MLAGASFLAMRQKTQFSIETFLMCDGIVWFYMPTCIFLL